MRDIVQVSVTLYNPFSGGVYGGSKIETTVPEVDSRYEFSYMSQDGYLITEGYLLDDMELIA